MAKRAPIARSDDLDNLSAIWILSCNDDNPIMTYKSIVSRLGLSDISEAKQLVASRSELFRPGILKSRLERWKERMKSGAELPGWLREIGNTLERENAIDSLTSGDVFRNQFRVEERAEKSGIETIDWGLRHIERLRKTIADEKDSRQRRWGTIIIPLTSLLIALASVVSSGFSQYWTNQAQLELKRYEVNFRPKHEVYSEFMASMIDASLAASGPSAQRADTALDRMEASFYSLQPFLSEDLQQKTFENLMQFTSLCYDQIQVRSKGPVPDEVLNKFVDSLIPLKDFFRTTLFDGLFDQP